MWRVTASECVSEVVCAVPLVALMVLLWVSFAVFRWCLLSSVSQHLTGDSACENGGSRGLVRVSRRKKLWHTCVNNRDGGASFGLAEGRRQ